MRHRRDFSYLNWPMRDDTRPEHRDYAGYQAYQRQVEEYARDKGLSGQSSPGVTGSPSFNPLSWPRGRIGDFRTLTIAAVDAVIRGLADGEVQGKQPGEWRSAGRADPMRTLLHKANKHLTYELYKTCDEDHLVHAITDAVMAYALREGK